MTKFEVKVQYRGIDQNGKDRVFKDTLLISAVSFGDAEEQAFKENEGHVDFEVKAIKLSSIKEVIPSPIQEDEGSNFVCTMEFITVDSTNGKEKRSKEDVLVGASNNDLASARLREAMRDITIDYEIVKVAFSPITKFLNEQQ